MQITQATIINLITIVLAGALIWYIRSRWGGIMAQVKEHFFTAHGFVIAAIWSVLVTGLICSVMFIRISSGVDTSISYPTEEGIADIIKGKRK